MRTLFALMAFMLCCDLFAIKQLRTITTGDFKKLSADQWRAVGKNIIVEGNVYVPVKSLELFADKMVINTESRDFEAIGNVRLYRWQDFTVPVTLAQLAKLENSSDTLVRSVTSSVDYTGNRSFTAKVAFKQDNMTANRIVGNLDSGYVRFDNVQMRYSTFVCRAKSGENMPDGVTIVKDAEISSCNYLESDNAHYSIYAKEMKFFTHKPDFYGIERIRINSGDRSMFLTNGFAKIYGIPVLWLPVFYKPKDETLGLFGSKFGKTGDWGFYWSMSRNIVFNDYPLAYIRLMGDWYEQRGFGYGLSGGVITEESRTDFFAYSIYDRDRYETDDYYKYRLKVPQERFNFKLSNVTHITPRLDFRGNFEWSSDRYFRRDFFADRYNADSQPATFVALEQQFDHFSTALYARFAVDDFYSTVEKLPEVRLDIQRQEILNTGLYYQGDAAATNFAMKWIEFNKHPAGDYTKLDDYRAFRFDMTHFLYYPVRTKFFNFVPRAGVKMTAYSRSSKRKVTDEDLIKMFIAADPTGNGRVKFNTYDSDGGSKVRFAAEFGFELSTKIHNTWQNVRSKWLKLDGVRHIMKPYMNYTYITDPTVERDHLYYFDDIDRLAEQNFVRFGLVNQLQTRNGDKVEDFFRMENFWDLHMEKVDGYSQLGNFGTLLSVRLFKDLSLHTKFLIDVSGDGEVADTIRHGRNVGKTGLALKWLNQWNIGVKYTPAENWEFTVGYNYLRPYSTRSAYSMGSTLTQINATSYFQRYYNDTNESFNIGGKFPLTPDHRTFGTFNVVYDVQDGGFDTLSFSIMRKFHCWQLIAVLEFDREYENRKHTWDVSYSIQANLTGLTAPMNDVQNTLLRGMNEAGSGNFKF